MFYLIFHVNIKIIAFSTNLVVIIYILFVYFNNLAAVSLFAVD